MKKSEIGTNAGIIWQLIDNMGAMDILDVKKNTKLKDNDIYLALGWLSREGKVYLDERNGKTNITLVH